MSDTEYIKLKVSDTLVNNNSVSTNFSLRLLAKTPTRSTSE